MLSMPDDLKENMNMMGKCFKQNETSGTVTFTETREPISESFQAWQQLLEIIVYVFLHVFTDRLTSRAVGNHGQSSSSMLSPSEAWGIPLAF